MEHSVCRSLVCVAAIEDRFVEKDLERENRGVRSNEQVHVESLKESKISTRGTYIDSETN